MTDKTKNTARDQFAGVFEGKILSAGALATFAAVASQQIEATEHEDHRPKQQQPRNQLVRTGWFDCPIRLV